MFQIRGRVRMMHWPTAMAILCAVSIHAGPASAQVRFVRAGAPAGGDGLTWATAYNDLQVALAAAVANPTITQLWVAQGTYMPAGAGGSRAATLQIRNGLALYGGFDGTEVTLQERDFEKHPTTLSGDLNGNDGPFTITFPPPSWLDDNSYHVVSAAGVSAATRIDGFTIRGGAASFPENVGAGIRVTGGSLVIENCTLTRNYALYEGAALLLTSATSATVRGCLFVENHVADGASGGGGISVDGGSAVIDNCEFLSNFVSPSGGIAGGGGIVSDDADVTVTDCTFTGNSGHDGGGILLQGGSLTIERCDFSGNYGRYGGGIYSSAADMHMTDCELRDTSGVEIGGGMILNGGSHVIEYCLFESHVGCDGGSAIYLASAVATIENSLFIDNRAVLFGGAGIWNDNYNNPDSVVTIDNCFFFGNQTSQGFWSPGAAVLSGRLGGSSPDHPSRTIIRSSTFLSNTSTFDPPSGGAVHAHELGLTTLCDSVFSNNLPTDYLATAGAIITVAQSCACQGDLNGSHSVDSDDLVGVILAWGACPNCPSSPCAADVAPFPVGDCAVNADDLIAVILNWGSCP
jgi:hypothetical protein